MLKQVIHETHTCLGANVGNQMRKKSESSNDDERKELTMNLNFILIKSSMELDIQKIHFSLKSEHGVVRLIKTCTNGFGLITD